MRLIHFTILSVAVLLWTGCKKSESTFSSPTEEEACVVQRSSSDGNIIPGQYIVVYKSSPDLAMSTSSRISQISRDVLQENEIPSQAMLHSFTGDLSGFVASLSTEEASRLQMDPSIHQVEPDRIIALNTCFTVVAPTLITWNINKVGYGNGNGKTAWVIDSGIDFNHADLNVDRSRSKSFIAGETSADDDHGHGTHVAGIIGGKNNSYGVLGVASGANLVSLRVLDEEGVGTVSGVIQALSYVIANASQGDVVNLSLGEEETSSILDQQIQLTASKGIYISMAAGNDSKAANLFSPGRTNGNNIYTVSAVDSLDNFAGFSNHGNDVIDYAAPGVRILSTFKGGLYARMSGTSMAAPHVAGLLLLNGGNLNYSTTAKNDPDGTPDKIASK